MKYFTRLPVFSTVQTCDVLAPLDIGPACWRRRVFQSPPPLHDMWVVAVVRPGRSPYHSTASNSPRLVMASTLSQYCAVLCIQSACLAPTAGWSGIDALNSTL